MDHPETSLVNNLLNKSSGWQLSEQFDILILYSRLYTDMGQILVSTGLRGEEREGPTA